AGLSAVPSPGPPPAADIHRPRHRQRRRPPLPGPRRLPPPVLRRRPGPDAHLPLHPQAPPLHAPRRQPLDHPALQRRVSPSPSPEARNEPRGFRQVPWLFLAFITSLPTLRQAPINDLAIEGGVGLPPRRFEVVAGAGQVAGAAVEFAERGIEQV